MIRLLLTILLVVSYFQSFSQQQSKNFNGYKSYTVDELESFRKANAYYYSGLYDSAAMIYSQNKDRLENLDFDSYKKIASCFANAGDVETAFIYLDSAYGQLDLKSDPKFYPITTEYYQHKDNYPVIDSLMSTNRFKSINEKHYYARKVEDYYFDNPTMVSQILLDSLGKESLYELDLPYREIIVDFAKLKNKEYVLYFFDIALNIGVFYDDEDISIFISDVLMYFNGSTSDYFSLKASLEFKHKKFKSDSIITLYDFLSDLARYRNVAYVDKYFSFNFNSTFFNNDAYTIIKIAENEAGKKLNIDKKFIVDSSFNFYNRSLSFDKCHLKNNQFYLEDIGLNSVFLRQLDGNNVYREFTDEIYVTIDNASINRVSVEGEKFITLSILNSKIRDLRISEDNQKIDEFTIENSYLNYLNINNSNIREVAVTNNCFQYLPVKPVSSYTAFDDFFRPYVQINGYLGGFKLYGNQFEVPVSFEGSTIQVVDFDENIFWDAVDISKTDLPEFRLYFPSNQLSKGLGTAYNDSLFTFNTGEYQNIKNTREIDHLIYSYQFLYNNYRQRGELDYANDVYVRIKSITKNKYRYAYVEKKTFPLWMKYKLSQIMEFYTDYGTNPTKAMTISVYIILVFAIFYFFFPSEWDKTSKKKLLMDFNTFKEKNEHGYFKPFLNLFWGFVVSLVNAITLSLNSFVTLGFGTIPTNGLARYVCIIQGFIGWFLLSIFTVALINQVLA